MAVKMQQHVSFSRSISTLPFLCERIKQTESEIVNMFRLASPKDYGDDDAHNHQSRSLNRSVRMLDERFIRILRIFKWGPDTEKAIEVLKMKVDHRLVREILKLDVEINVKMQFFRWAGKRKNFEHDSTTFMALIRCLNESGLFGEMWHTIQDMVRSTFLIRPSDLSEIVKILGQAKMVNKALSIFYQIKRRKCKPTSSTYNSIILMLIQEEHYDKVHQLYIEMCNEGNCLPDTLTYSALIVAFGKLGREESAFRLFHEMKENGLNPTPKIYTTLVSIYFKMGKVDKALSLVQEMRGSGCPPTVYTYTELIKGMGKARRFEEGYELFVKMLKEGCKPDVVVLNNVINLLGKAGKISEAVKLFEEMEEIFRCTPNVVTYNTVIKALFECKCPTFEALSWLERMKANGIVPSSFTYSILIDGFCKTNRLEKALILLEEMDEKGFPPCPAAYCSLINALGKANRYEAANELFQELKENCGSSSSRVYAVMIKHFGKCGHLTQAVDLFNEMKNRGCSPDVYAYNAVMSGMVRAGMVDEAYSMLQRMEEDGCEPDLNSHNIILNGLARTGGPIQAIAMFKKMQQQTRLKPDVVSYNTVLGCMSRAGMFEEAAMLMKDMEAKGFKYDLITYSSIFDAVGKVDEVTDGERLPLAVKELGNCDLYPQSLKHNPNGRFVVVCGDGEYIIYTTLAWRNRSFGSALEFVWSSDGEYAVRESTSKIKIFSKTFQEKKSIRPTFSAERIYGGTLLSMCSSDFICFYDWVDCRLIRRIDVTVKNLYWADSGDLVAIASDTSFYILKYNLLQIWIVEDQWMSKELRMHLSFFMK